MSAPGKTNVSEAARPWPLICGRIFGKYPSLFALRFRISAKRPFPATKDVDYECIVDPMLDDYYIGDAMKLQQVLINILSNAIKFTGEGGKVTFSAAQRKRTKNDAVIQFIVNDTGVAMSEEFLPHIFEPFSQESTGTTALYGGTALGLAISKNIVDTTDGSIAVRSIKGSVCIPGSFPV